MTSKQEEIVNPLDDFKNVSSIGCLRDNATLDVGENNEVSTLVPPVSSTSTNSAHTRENRECYVYKEPVAPEGLPSKNIYVAEDNEATQAVTYQLKDTQCEEAPANVYECGDEDSDDLTENSDGSNTDFDGIQPENVVTNTLEGDANSAHSSGVNILEWISPYAVAYRQCYERTTTRSDQRNLADDPLQPYAVVYEEQDCSSADQTTERRSVSNVRGDSAHTAFLNTCTSSEADGDRKDGLSPNPMYVPNVPQPTDTGGRNYNLSGAQLACIVTVSVIVGALVVSAVVFPVVFRTASQQEDTGDMEMTLPHTITEETTVEWKTTQHVEYTSLSSSSLVGRGEKESEPKRVVFGGDGPEPGKFCGASGVVVSPTSEIFVADMYNRRVQVFSMKGAYLRHFATVVSEDEILTMEPDSIAIDADCFLWVVGNINSSGYAVQYTTTGHRVRTLHPLFPNNSFTGVAVNAPRDLLIVAENWRDYTEVKVLLFDGTVVRSFGRLQLGRIWPTRVATNADGNIFVSDRKHAAVHVYKDTGQYMFTIGEDGVPSSIVESDAVSDVCVDGSGQVLVSYVYSPINDTDVAIFTDRGEYARSIVSTLNSADGMAVGPDGQLVVTSRMDDIVVVLSQY
ncbi:zinc ion binding [Branchiostoma belcheri]|nr:zinc ion binding [Branchiostoma belcheri]